MNIESRWATNEENKPIALCTTVSSVFLEDGTSLENYLKNTENLKVSIVELWSGSQSASATLTLNDNYADYDIIISRIEVLPNYPLQERFDFMLKGGNSITGGFCENSTYIAQYRLNNWNGTSVNYVRDNKGGGSWDLTLIGIYGIKFETYLHEYSTEEKVVGKWVDGKPIYEKTFSSVTITNNADNFVSDNFGDKVLRHFQIDFNGISNNLTSSNNYSDTLFINTSNQLMYYISRTGSWWNGLNTANITVQYTKTTD